MIMYLHTEATTGRLEYLEDIFCRIVRFPMRATLVLTSLS